MRSLAELRALAEQHGVDHTEFTQTTQFMDALRDVIGGFTAELQVDPMKAKDLKNLIDWSLPGPSRFAAAGLVSAYLNDYHLVEPKLDGVRVRLWLGDVANSLNTGRRSTVTFSYTERSQNFPHLRDALAGEFSGTVLDAELIMPSAVFLDEKRGWTVGPLNSTMAVLTVNPEEAVARQERHGLAELHVFDILALKGESLMDAAYVERREALANVIPAMGVDSIRLVPSYPATPESIQQALDDGYEGVMIKRRNGKYLPGKRGTEWLKVKKMSTGDFFIVGSNPGKGRNEGKVGSLKVAYLTPVNGEMRPPSTPEEWERAHMFGVKYVADVRGFDDATCDLLTNPVTGKVREEYIGRVIEIMGQSRTKNDRIRHPHFIRWRDDKGPADCGIEQLHLFAGEPDNA